MKVPVKHPSGPIASILGRPGKFEASVPCLRGLDLCIWIPAAQSGRLSGRVQCLITQDAASTREEQGVRPVLVIRLGVILIE